MLTITDMTKRFGARVLFERASLQVNRGDRIGLIGPNGAGKTTLFSLVLGHDSADTGEIRLERGISVGYLPQETAPAGDETVLQLAMQSSPSVAELLRRMSTFAAGHDTDSHDFHEVHAQFEAIGGYQLEPRAKALLRGLAFRDQDFDRPARAMSGGWVMRAHLARLLVQQPDLLMLDEPTNHLDLETLQWFQGYLQTYPGAILLISHDREFLNRLVGSVVEIRQRQLVRYRGNYDEFLVQREAQEAQRLAAHNHQQKEIKKLTDFAARFRAKASKASQAQSKLKQLQRMDRIEAPVREGRSITFRFPQPVRSGLRVITLKNIHHAYGNTVVYRGMDFEAERGQRIVLVGPNGAGKSTLLKLLAGVLLPQSGSRELGLHVRVGYYAQHRVEMLNRNYTVIEEILDMENAVPEQTARTVLGSFLFRGDDIYKPVGVLSGGEKSRLALVKLLLDPPNLLLMDEPTTHLDMPSIDALVEALAAYTGTLIFISHDVYCIRKLARHVLHVKAGRLTPYHGDYQYYLDRTTADAASAVAPQPATPPRQARPAAAGQSDRQRKRKQESTRRAQQKLVEDLEREIIRMEERQRQLIADLEDPATYTDAGRAVSLNREMQALVATLAHTTAEWEQAATRLEGL